MTDDHSWQPPGENPAPQAPPVPAPVRPAQPKYGEYATPAQPGFQPPQGPPLPPPHAWQQQAPYAAPTGMPYGPPTGWTPPPKPGLIPLRPLSFGTLIGAPFQVIRRNPKVTVGMALLIVGIPKTIGTLLLFSGFSLLISRIQFGTASDQSALTAGAFGGFLLLTLASALISLVSGAVLQGFIVVEVARETLGQKLTVRSLWHLCKSRVWALIGWALILTAAWIVAFLLLALGVVLLSLLGTAGAIFAILLAVFGLIAIGLLAVWLVTKVALVPCAVVLEKLPIRLAVRRSWSLTQGNFWKTFGVIALIFLIVSVVQEIVTAPVSLIGGFAAAVLSPTSISPDSTAALTQTFTSPITIIASIVGIVVGAILYVAQASAVSLLYIDLRMRKEGLDLKLVRYVEARQTGLADVQDPFVPETSPPFEPAPPQRGAPTL